MQISLEATGSSNNTYDVIIITDEENNVRLLCGCTAGLNGLMCKHRAALLDGTPGEIFPDVENFDAAVKFLVGSGMLTAYAKYKKMLADLDVEAKKIKKTQQGEKQAYARLLEGRVSKFDIFEPYNLRRLMSTTP